MGSVPTPDEIARLFDAWDAALATGDADAVVALYARDAVLLPTFSDRVRTTEEGRRDYFAGFLRRRPRARIVQGHARAYGDVAVHSGIYAFTFGSDLQREARARFTFVYRRIDGRWWIVEHHSSCMPEVASARRLVAASAR
jgi:uncharacterized protein (TIGR02246 family)